jgi:hypothetical protein
MPTYEPQILDLKKLKCCYGTCKEKLVKAFSYVDR